MFQNTLFALIILSAKGMVSSENMGQHLLPNNPPLPLEYLPETNPNFPRDRINDVVKGRWGFLWVATDRGLLRYDGQDVHWYRRELGVEGSLASDKVRVVFEDRFGQLWIGTQNGLHRLDRRTGKVQLWLGPGGDGNILPSQNIWSIGDDDQGRLWVGTDRGLAVGELGSLIFEPVKALAGIGITAIVQDESGQMLMGTEAKGLRFGNDPHGSWPTVQGGADLSVSHLLRHGPDTLVGTWNCGMVVRRADHWLPINQPEPIGENRPRITALTTTQDAGVWFGMGDDLFQFLPNGDSWQWVHPKPFADSKPRAITALHGDWDEMLWVATVEGGLHYKDLRAKQFQFLSSQQKEIYAVKMDGKGQFWFGTKDGLRRLDGSMDAPYLLKKRHVTAMIDLNDHQWLALTDKGIYRVDLESGEETFLTRLPLTWRIQHLVDELFVVGTAKGLYEWHVGEGVVKHLPGAGDPSCKSQAYVTSLVRDDMDQLWVGTYGNGVNCLDLDMNLKRKLAYEEDHGHGLSSNNVTDVMVGPNQNIWIGTHDGGLNKYDPKSETLTRWTVKDGLPDNAIMEINYDAKEFLWLSTGEGLVRMDPKTSAFWNFSQQDGFMIGAALPGSSWVDAKRRWIIFGGTYGAVAFDTQSLEVPSPAALVFTDLRLDQQLVNHLMLDRNFMNLDQPYKSITMGVAFLDFRKRVPKPYRFRREHIDETWTPRQAVNVVSYTGYLPYGGKGHLEVEAQDHYLNTVQKKILIQVKRPLWVSWLPLWMFLMFGLLVLGTHWVLGRRMRKRQSALEEKARFAQERQVLAEARAEVAEIQSRMAQRERSFQQEVTQVLQQHLEQVSTEISNDVHDGPLGGVHALAFRLHALEKLTEQENVKQALAQVTQQVIPELAEQLRSLCGELLRPDFQAGLQAELVNYIAVIKEQAPHLSIAIHFDADTDHGELSVLATLYRIFRTLMKNILKHAEAQHIDIQIKSNSERLEMRLQDDGKGFLVPTSWTVFKDKGHFGLYMAHYFAQTAGGLFQVNSELGTGTQVQVSLPKHQGGTGEDDSNRHC